MKSIVRVCIVISFAPRVAARHRRHEAERVLSGRSLGWSAALRNPSSAAEIAADAPRGEQSARHADAER